MGDPIDTISSICRAGGIAILLVIAAVHPAIASDTISAPESSAPTATPSQKGQSVELNREYFTGYWTDTKNILTAPSRWGSSDWLEASLVMGTAVVLYTQDDNIKTWFQDNKDTTKDHLSDDAKKLYSLALPAAMAGLGAYGYAGSDDRARTAFLLSTESFLITGAFVQVLKHTTGRHRPYTGDPHDTWSGPTWKSEWLSFPSGDASTAFSIASVVASEYSNMLIPPLAYGIAALIGLERIYTNSHWASDVFVGSAIGYYTGKAVVASHSGNREIKVSIAPMTDADTKGVLVTYRF